LFGTNLQYLCCRTLDVSSDKKSHKGAASGSSPEPKEALGSATPTGRSQTSTKRKHSKVFTDTQREGKNEEVKEKKGRDKTEVQTPPPNKRRKLAYENDTVGALGAQPLETGAESKQAPPTTVASSTTQGIIQFAVFCLKRRDSVALEYPELSEKEIEYRLRDQWSSLDDDTRSRFIPMGSDMTHVSRMMRKMTGDILPDGMFVTICVKSISFTVVISV